MRKLVLIIALCLIPVIASAGGIQQWHMMVMKQTVAAGGGDGALGVANYTDSIALCSGDCMLWTELTVTEHSGSAGPVSQIEFPTSDSVSESEYINGGLYCCDAGGCTGGYSDGDVIRAGTAIFATGGDNTSWDQNTITFSSYTLEAGVSYCYGYVINDAASQAHYTGYGAITETICWDNITISGNADMPATLPTCETGGGGMTLSGQINNGQ